MKTLPQILIVDDEINILKVIKRLLSKYELELFTTTSPKEALELIHQKHFDLIISDQRMPDIEGIHLLAHVKEHSPDTIRILMSGYSDIEVLVDAINSGNIYQYIAKPWENDKFIRTVFKALETKTDVEQNLILQKLFKAKNWIDELSQTRLTRRKDFLNHIIISNPKITNELKEEAATLDLDLGIPYYCCLISLSDNPDQTDTFKLNELIFMLNMLPNCIAWDMNGFICLLLKYEASEEGSPLAKTVKNIEELVSDYWKADFSMGISNMQVGLEGILLSYNQAHDAYRNTKGSVKAVSRVIYYHNLGVMQLLTKINDHKVAEEFVNNILGNLIRYDREKGSDFVLTLEELLINPNLKEAAAKLFIHPKTMIFRKNRIEKILDISLEDYETRLSLGVAIKLHKLNR